MGRRLSAHAGGAGGRRATSAAMASLAGSVVGSPRLSMRAARRWRFGSAADAGSKAAVEWCSNQSIAATTRSRDRNVWAYSADDMGENSSDYPTVFHFGHTLPEAGRLHGTSPSSASFLYGCMQTAAHFGSVSSEAQCGLRPRCPPAF